MAKSNRTNRVRGTADSAENQPDTVGTDASDLPVEEPDADEAGLDAHDLPGTESEQDEADTVTDSGKTFPEKPESAAAEAEDDTLPRRPTRTKTKTDSMTDSEYRTQAASSKKPPRRRRRTPRPRKPTPGPRSVRHPTASGRNRKAAESESSGSKKSGKNSAKSGNPAKRASNRKTASYTSTPGTQTIKPNARWFVPTMVTVLLLGLAWLVVFYVSSGAYPVGAWGYWNLGVGFAILVVGLVMSTRWR